MNARYGLLIVCVCGMGLAGCANWQTRAGSNGAAGTTMQPAGIGSAPVLAPATGVAPGTVFSNEPPPPMPPPPSDPGLALAPLGSSPSASRLDLSVADEGSGGSRPDKMYNLDSKPAKSSSSSKSGSSSTLSKLASKAGTSKSSTPAPDKPASAVERLKEASSSGSASNAEEDAIPVRKAEEPRADIVEPAPKITTKVETAPAVVDTALLAQPVRKGSDDAKKGSDSSKGPQSSVSPGKKIFEKNKAVIYPVSNPASEIPVDITQFS